MKAEGDINQKKKVLCLRKVGERRGGKGTSGPDPPLKRSGGRRRRCDFLRYKDTASKTDWSLGDLGRRKELHTAGKNSDKKRRQLPIREEEILKRETLRGRGKGSSAKGSREE